MKKTAGYSINGMNSLLYIGIMVAFGKLGQYKRLADREDLTGEISSDQ